MTFGEVKRVYCQSMNERDCVLGNDSVDQLCENKNLDVVKSCISSFYSNADERPIRLEKKWASYSLRISIAETLTHKFTSNYGDRHVFLHCYTY